MKRLAPLCLAVVLLVASACGADDVKAATVNGERIPEEQVTDELEAIDANEAYVEAIEESTPVKGDAPASFNSAFVAQVLTRQIVYELILQEVAERDLDVGREDVDRAGQDLRQQIPEDIIGDFPQDYVERITGWNAAALVLQGDLLDLPGITPEGARAYFEEHPEEFQQVCASHILVETEAQAQEIRTQLLGGADFATVARERSTDTGSAEQGGELPCSFPGTFQPAFEAAAESQEVGAIGEPVETEFGWHIIRVNERTRPEFDDVSQDVLTRLGNLANQRFTEWLTEAVAEADIDVNPRYGSWNDEAGQVDPPGGPTTTLPEAPGGVPGVPGAPGGPSGR